MEFFQEKRCSCLKEAIKFCFFSNCKSPYLCDKCTIAHTSEHHKLFLVSIPEILGSQAFGKYYDFVSQFQEKQQHHARQIGELIKAALDEMVEKLGNLKKSLEEKFAVSQYSEILSYQFQWNEFQNLFNSLQDKSHNLLKGRKDFKDENGLDTIDLFCMKFTQFLNQIHNLKSSQDEFYEVQKEILFETKSLTNSATQKLEEAISILETSYVNATSYKESSNKNNSNNNIDQDESKESNSIEIPKLDTIIIPHPPNSWGGPLMNFSYAKDLNLILSIYVQKEILILQSQEQDFSQIIQTTEILNNYGIEDPFMYYCSNTKILIVSAKSMYGNFLLTLKFNSELRQFVPMGKTKIEAEIVCLYPVYSKNMILGAGKGLEYIPCFDLITLEQTHRINDFGTNVFRDYKPNFILSCGQGYILLIDYENLAIANKYYYGGDSEVLDITPSKEYLCLQGNELDTIQVFKIIADNECFLEEIIKITYTGVRLYGLQFITETKIIMTDHFSLIDVYIEEGNSKVKYLNHFGVYSLQYDSKCETLYGYKFSNEEKGILRIPNLLEWL